MANYAMLESGDDEVWINVDQVLYVRGKGHSARIVFASAGLEVPNFVNVSLPAADVVEAFQAAAASVD